jgi:hypothetical protein
VQSKSKRCLLLAIGLWLAGHAAAVLADDEKGEKIEIQWQFDEPDNFRGWAAGSHIADAGVGGGVLRGRAVDWDPILIGPVFEIQATPTQRIEINIKATETAGTELFWTETLEGQYGGFNQDKHNTFSVVGDGQFHIYQIYPFWHAMGKIVRLRFDPPGEGRFEIAWIRIVDDGSVRRSNDRAWRFAGDLGGWRPWQQVSEPVVTKAGLQATTSGEAPILMSPLVDVAAAENSMVCLRMAVSAGKSGAVYCVSDSQVGWETISFPLRADGKMHSYNIDVATLGRWRDRIVMLGLRPTDAAAADVTIESIEIADEPRGPAELEFAYFGRTEGVNRAGRPAEVTCTLRNLGGELAQNVTATLLPAEGVGVLDAPTKTIERISLYLPKTTSWRIQSATPGPVQLTATVRGPRIEPITRTASIDFTPMPEVPATSYVPEPKPVKPDVDVGAFYFPGWYDTSRWRPILDFPMRKPVLGWYDEANPEVADWQIKWAVEHGITFFMVDWYWSEGQRQLEHWVHQAYANARHRKYLKWAVMWANHNRPNTHSAEDWKKVTQYWIDNYFGMEEYYRIDGRPAVFIWSPYGIRRDVGGSEQAAELYATSQAMARQAGYRGIYFVAMSSHESEAGCSQLKAEGYEAFTSYHGFQLAEQLAKSNAFTFDKVVETSPEVWRKADERSAGLVYMPIVDTGWASEPWHKSKARVIGGRTPELFGRLCREAKEYAQSTGKRIVAVGPINEWGEGSYIEPYAEYGFEDLDQLRAAFCPPGKYPPNLIPSDVGLGPYDFEFAPPKTAWEFNTDGDREGWSPNGLLKVEVRGGLLEGESSGGDPIFTGPAVEVEAAAFRSLIVRMRVDRDDGAQLFWGTTVAPQSETNSVRFDLVGDGELHDYQVDLGQCRAWRGIIVSLRFDPVGRGGVKFAIDSIRLR